jgi:4'-phosphopantetheinyl transferase
MKLEHNEIHIWSADLGITTAQEEALLALLSPDEHERAERFKYLQHRMRFIAARGSLRQILSNYLDLPPKEIIFAYGEHHKPYLTASPIQFNLAHSGDMAVYAITLNHPIGIDIEKIQNNYNPDIAKRFFNPQEYAALLALPEHKRILGFYCLWARKEAIIKATGRGISMGLATFNVSVNDVSETVIVQNEAWSLLPLSIHPDYASAVATNQTIKTISNYRVIL